MLVAADKEFKNQEDAQADYGNATKVGRMAVGEDFLYFPKTLKTAYYPLDNIIWVFQREKEKKGRVCTSAGIAAQKVVFVSREQKEYELTIRTNQEAQELLNVIQRIKPDIRIGYQ